MSILFKNLIVCRVVANEIPEMFRNIFPFDQFNEMQSAIFEQINSSDVCHNIISVIIKLTNSRQI
jgi:hypothetical protein